MLSQPIHNSLLRYRYKFKKTMTVYAVGMHGHWTSPKAFGSGFLPRNIFLISIFTM